MPLDDGCRFDQHYAVEDLRPDSVKPHPEKAVAKEESRLARALPAQDGHLVSQSNQLEFQRGAAAQPEREQGTDRGQKCDHVKRWAVVSTSSCLNAGASLIGAALRPP